MNVYELATFMDKLVKNPKDEELLNELEIILKNSNLKPDDKNFQFIYPDTLVGLINYSVDNEENEIFYMIKKHKEKFLKQYRECLVDEQGKKETWYMKLFKGKISLYEKYLLSL